jgi:hypothetical protein
MPLFFFFSGEALDDEDDDDDMPSDVSPENNRLSVASPFFSEFLGVAVPSSCIPSAPSASADGASTSFNPFLGGPYKNTYSRSGGGRLVIMRR